MSSSNIPPVPPPLVVVSPGQPSSYRRHVNRGGMTMATSLFDIFDFKFEKYVTPIIVKVTWVLVVVIAGLWITAATVGIIASMPQKGFGEIRGSAGYGAMPLREIKDSTVSLEVRLLFMRAFMFVVTIISTVIGLLWARVALEAMIVLFNIANAAASIDSKTPPPGNN